MFIKAFKRNATIEKKQIMEAGNGNTVFSFPPLDQIFFHINT